MNRLLSRAAGWTPYLTGGLAIAFAAAIVASPESSFQASLQGLKLWWTLVFPALLPFLILSEMLSASGAVHAAGVLLEPLMIRLFRLPGSAGWSLALGMAAGCPAGAQSAAELRRQEALREEEAARLAALSHFASPVALLIVAGTALLHSPAAGYLLLAVHWLAGLAAGAAAARLGRAPKARAERCDARQGVTRAAAGGAEGCGGASAQPPHGAPGPAAVRPGLMRRVLDAAAAARARDGRPFGRLLGDSVAAAVQNAMMAGGFIIGFAVAVRIVRTAIPALPGALGAAALELHLGAQQIAAAASGHPAGATGPLAMALLAAALGWGGVCAQLQTLACLRKAGASGRYLPFALHRLLHAGFSFILMLPLRPFVPLLPGAAPAFSAGEHLDREPALRALGAAPRLALLLACLLLGLVLLSGGLSLAGRLRRKA